MKIVLVSGVRHKTYIKHISKYTPVNARVNLSLDSLKDYLLHYSTSAIDVVLITDGGLSCNPWDNVRIMQELFAEAVVEGIYFIVLTHDRYLNYELSRFSNLNVSFSAFTRVTEAEINAALRAAPIAQAEAAPIAAPIPATISAPIAEQEIEPKNSKKEHIAPLDSIWASMNEKEDEDTDMQEYGSAGSKRKSFGIGGAKNKAKAENEGYGGISRAHSRAIAFTGRAGAGVTGSVMNIAYCAAQKGMRVIIVDLDTEYRTANLYLNKFCTMAEESEDVSRSLIKTLANPQNYMETAVSITDNLWVTGLGYDFDDNQAMAHFFTEQKAAAMVSALKNRFDYVFVDIPLRVLSRMAGLMMHFDLFALCVENNLHAAITTLRALINDFSSEDIRYLNMKSKLLVTKYNDESMYDEDILSPDRLAGLMTGNLCDDFVDEMEIAGEIPYARDFDRQIESDIPVYETNSLLRESYDKALSRL